MDKSDLIRLRHMLDASREAGGKRFFSAGETGAKRV